MRVSLSMPSFFEVRGARSFQPKPAAGEEIRHERA